MRISTCLFMLMSVVFANCQPETAQKNSWTLLYYAAGCNSSEVDLMGDVKEMIEGLNSNDIEIILLIDRIVGHSEDSLVLGSNFTDTKLYSIRKGEVTELSGKEELPELSPKSSSDLNLGDAEVLKKFIRFGKQHARAEKYGLILRSHGNGRNMCPDLEQEQRDPLWIAEISEVLTKDESVDFLGLDVCSMAGLENFYQWRPSSSGFSADYILSSAPLSASYPYAAILGAISEKYPNGTQELSPHELGTLFFEAIQTDQPWCSWSLVDNTQINEVRQTILSFESSLTKESRVYLANIRANCIDYSTVRDTSKTNYYLNTPHLDAADYYRQIAQSDEFSAAQRQAAQTALSAIDRLVLRSYYGRGFLSPTSNFENGISGVYQILPQMKLADGTQTERFEKACSEWFTPALQQNDNGYGHYHWLQP